MDLNLKNRRAVVTGSTGGIGYAAARELASMGATVAINGRTQARVDAAIAKLKGEVKGGTFIGAPGDLTSAEGANAIIRAVPRLRHPRQQRGHLRAEAVLRDPRRGLDALLRDQRALGRAAGASLHARDGEARMGTRGVHLVGIRRCTFRSR